MTSERRGRELIDATRPFMVENRARSVFELLTTLLALCAAGALAAGSFTHTTYERVAGSVLEGLLIVRMFIVYHDAMHGAIFRGTTLTARMGRASMNAFGVLVLTPPNVWKQTHNYHHAHTAKIVGSHVGSFPVLTVAMYRNATPRQRFMYRLARNPLTIAFAYVTIFVFGMCVHPFLRSPRKNWDSALAIVVHVILSYITWRAFGLGIYLHVLVFPLAIAFAVGGYLFYAQHNFPDIEIQPRETWEYTRAALESSSFIDHGIIFRWFTGNIGFHHVHHLNAAIPFYQLPAAMNAIPELQHPRRASMTLPGIVECLRLKLWDPESHRMVSWKISS